MIDLSPLVGKQVVLMLKVIVPVFGSAPNRDLELVYPRQDPRGAPSDQPPEAIQTGFLHGILKQHAETKTFWLRTRNCFEEHSFIDICIDPELVAVCYAKSLPETAQQEPAPEGA